MAYLPADEIEAIVLRHRLPKVTEKTITDRQQLERELADIRARGYAFSRGERLPGAVAIAAPIFAADAPVFGSLVITMPEQRFKMREVPALVQAVTAEAAGLSALLGGPEEPNVGLRPTRKTIRA
jgi:DNA-binding IclR family transcriptional regulator